LLFWSICGFVAQRMYRSFQAGSLTGVFLYPLILVAMLETPRLLFLSNQRVLPAVAALGATVWLASRGPVSTGTSVESKAVAR